MDFNSLLFLMVFLPLLLGLYWFIHKFENESRTLSRALLLLGGVAFYVFNSSLFHCALIIGVSLFHYLMCFFLSKVRNSQETRGGLSKFLLIFDITVSALLLLFFKYSNYLPLPRQFAFPLALSFITFQSISFTVDVYRNTVKYGTVSLFSYLLYIFLFMKLIEGPITTFNQIKDNSLSFDKLFNGIVRFCFGLAKKVLIADVLATVVTSSLSEVQYIGTSVSWLCIVCYTIELFFDFSGYCDMAIGLGLMFGYELPENFNNPYLSTSIRDFWRRWHISLSSWFKNYVYIPLGGNRKGQARTLLNLFIIFVLTGLWHGPTINFLFWGLFFGFFMIVERLFLGKLLDNNKFKPINWVYSIFVVMMGWVLFICPSITDIGYFFRNLFSIQDNISSYSVLGLMSLKVTIALTIGVLFSTVVPLLLNRFWPNRNKNSIWVYSKAFIGLALLIVCVVAITNGSYSPSLYGGF